MRLRGTIGAIVALWLLIGTVAAWQRGYFVDTQFTCAKSADVALTVAAGPLNYTHVNPRVACHLPQPSV
jgi:hypothetical protein